MEITPEDRQRIYAEEKARIEIRNHLEAQQRATRSAPIVAEVRTRPSDGVAAVLSFFFPGAGQMYKGKVGQGFVWLFCTIFGYILLIIPGLILHLICVFHAASTEPA